MSLHLSPETEQVKAKVHTNWNDLLNHARKLERERDEAREELHDIRLNLGADAEGYTLLHAVCVLQQERDDERAGREAYKQLAVKHALEREQARSDRENSRQSLAFALEELDEARSALMKIEQLFIDGTDVYGDREKMATIAIEALEVAK